MDAASMVVFCVLNIIHLTTAMGPTVETKVLTNFPTITTCEEYGKIVQEAGADSVMVTYKCISVWSRNGKDILDWDYSK